MSNDNSRYQCILCILCCNYLNIFVKWSGNFTHKKCPLSIFVIIIPLLYSLNKKPLNNILTIITEENKRFHLSNEANFLIKRSTDIYYSYPM